MKTIFNLKKSIMNNFNYTILKNTKDIDTNNVLLITPKYKKRKFSVLHITCHSDGSESNTHISYYSNYNEAKKSMLNFPSWYDYIKGEAKNLRGEISKLP